MALEKIYSFESFNIDDGNRFGNDIILFNVPVYTTFAGLISEGRRGGRCLKFDPTTSSTTSYQYFLFNVPTIAFDDIVFGFAWKQTIGNATDPNKYCFVSWRTIDAGSPFIPQIRFLNNGQMKVYDANGNVRGTCSKILSDQVWHYIEVNWQFLQSTTVNNAIRVDGEVVFNDALGVDYFRNVPLGLAFGNYGTDTETFWLDDLYIVSRNVTPGPTGFLGDIFVDTLYPTGLGTTNDFFGSDGTQTGNWQWIKETGVANTGDYVEGSGVGDVDLYKFETLSSNVQTIHGVQFNTYLNKSEAGNKFYSPVARVSGSNYFKSSKGISYDPDSQFQVWQFNPANTGNWTKGELDILELGIRLDS